MNKSLRVVLNVKFDENFVPSMATNEMYKKLKLLKLEDIYKYFLLKFVHSFLYGSKTQFFDLYFFNLLPNHGYSTRGVKINYPSIRLDMERTLPVYNCVKLINSVPDYLLQPQSDFTLKKRSKSYFLEKY